MAPPLSHSGLGDSMHLREQGLRFSDRLRKQEDRKLELKKSVELILS